MLIPSVDTMQRTNGRETTSSNLVLYMTPAESARIKTEAQSLLCRSNDSVGAQRRARGSRSAERLVTTASFIAEMQDAPDDFDAAPERTSIPALATGERYPPCTSAVEQLKRIKLSDLRAGTHHRGCITVLKRIAPVVALNIRSWTIVQDYQSSNSISKGDAERLELVLHGKDDPNHPLLDGLRSFLVKEPFFTVNDQGESTLRIDHPSDVVALENIEGSMLSLTALGFLTTNGGIPEGPDRKTPQQWKKEGNAALQMGQLHRAHTSYSIGLRLTCIDRPEVTSLTLDLFRNRAHANLRLSRFDEAKSDALSSLVYPLEDKRRALDGKAYFRAGCAAYQLEAYHEAKEYFSKQIQLTPGDRDAQNSLKQTLVRLHEQATGTYDWLTLKANLSDRRPRVNAATFAGPIMIRDTGTRAGRGLFATRPIKAGELILCEKAFAAVFAHERQAQTVLIFDVHSEIMQGHPAGLTQATVHKVMHNPSKMRDVLDLYSDYPGLGKQTVVDDGGRGIVDVFQVQSIVSRNAFGLTLPSGKSVGDVRRYGAGLWIRASFINHSCLPNTSKEVFGDMMVFRATSLIAEGEEITHAYVQPEGPYEERQKALQDGWRFQCTCEKCVKGADRHS